MIGNLRVKRTETEALVAVLFVNLPAIEIEHVIREQNDLRRRAATENYIATVVLLETASESFLRVRSAVKPGTKNRVARRCESLPALYRSQYLPLLSLYSAVVIATNVEKPDMSQADAPDVVAIFAMYIFILRYSFNFLLLIALSRALVMPQPFVRDQAAQHQYQRHRHQQ